MSDMNIYEYAMKLEKEGEEFYRDLADQTNDPGLKKILTMLATEEVKHYRLFEKMLNDADVSTLPKMEVFAEATSIFENMKEIKESYDFSSNQIEYYRKALETEEANESFYMHKAAEAKTEEHKAIFLRIAEEERKHLILLENLVEFVSQPEQYLESAEFYKMAEAV